MEDNTIHDLLTLYDKGKLCLPEMQRPYVWKQRQVAALIDSLYRDIPIGLLLLWEPKDTKHFRALKGGKLKDPTTAIIDGQQRLTSIHDVANQHKIVMFDTSDPEGNFQIENKKTRADDRWVSVYDVWTSDSFTFTDSLATKLNMTPTERSELGKKVAAINKIKERKPPSFILKDMDDPEKVTQVFIRINESGKKLSKSDTAFAIAALKFPGLVMERLSSIQQKNKNWKTSTASRNSFFANALATITVNTVKMSPFQEYLLRKTTSESKIKKNLKSLEIGLQYTYEFLQNNFGINEKNNLQLIPNRSALLPLVNLFSQTNGQLPKQQTELLKLWTFLAFHHSQYVGKAYGKYLDQDIRAINPKNTLETIKAWLESIKEWVSDTQVYNIGKGLNDKSRFTVFFALKLNNATDWWTGTSIENIPKIEYHHIFPRAVLKKAGYTKMEINDPRNIAVISEYVNRKQKDKKPVDYFNDRSLITDPERLFSQFVPRKDKQLWEVKNYEKFLDVRGELIMEKLNEFVRTSEAEI